MKIVVLISGGRTGSDFFQSLLDGHPEISQFPGIFFFDEFLLKLQREKNIEKIANIFVENYKHFFDSRLNLRERHNMLGDDRNDFFIINANLFKNFFIDLMKNKNLNQENILKSLNLAYSQASGEDITKKKILLLHLHHFEKIKPIVILDFDIIYTTRDPLANYTSIVKNWYRYKEGKYISPWSYYFHMKRLVNGLYELNKYQKKTHIIQLENLHTKNIKVMEDFCNLFDISYNETMKKSTYHGKKWWGDELSVKFLSGVNPNFKNNIDENIINKKDIEYLQNYLKDFLVNYNYPIRSNGLKFSFIKFLPLKAEIKIWKKSFTKFNILQILSIFFYWIKRINLMKKKKFNKQHFPRSLGSN